MAATGTIIITATTITTTIMTTIMGTTTTIMAMASGTHMAASRAIRITATSMPERAAGSALARLAAWLSPAFPTGGFSYSHGLERAAQRVLALGDGAYPTKQLLAALPDRVDLLARCAKNRALFHLPPARTGKGRPRKYGERAKRPDAWLDERAGWRHDDVVVRDRTIPLTWRCEGPFVVKGAAARANG